MHCSIMRNSTFSCHAILPGLLLIFVVLLVILIELTQGFSFCRTSLPTSVTFRRSFPFRGLCQRKFSESIFIILADNDDEDDESGSGVVGELIEDDDDDDTPIEEDPYVKMALSEFTSNVNTTSNAAADLVLASEMSTAVDWGGALGKLRQRFDDIEQGKSGNPSQALFRLMSAQSPNQAIGSFVNSASPQIVQAMSGAVSSLLGGLSSPASGVETIVKATGSKIGSLCFQLQMTGYVFKINVVGLCT
jgi:hypothetical protein